ncbi:MAG: hypothetical protein ACE5FD_06100 [Anaerolineae bacterium]
MNNLLDRAEEALMGIICWHEMGLFPVEFVHFLPEAHSGAREARLLAGIAYLKYVDEEASWD